jgi:hypothetical protein
MENYLLFQLIHLFVGNLKKEWYLKINFIGSGPRQPRLLIEKELPVLYWWEVYVAMQCPAKGNKLFFCPCRIRGISLVLAWILRTRCNAPHFDCLVYDMDSDEARVVRQSEKWQAKYECDPTLQDYDVDRMKRCAILLY